MPVAQLNLDVLRQICDFLTDVPDVLSFSFTCSTLRPVGVKRRLSMRPITIWSAQSIRDLYKFIFVDEKQRGLYIRTITIPVHDVPPEPSEELVNSFLAVFASATRVSKLSFYLPVPDDDSSSSATDDSDGSEPLSLFSHPRILSAVAEMTTLQDLHVVAPTDTASYFLGSTRSTLKSFLHGDIDGDTQESFPVTVAPQVIPALKEIELSFELFKFAMTSMPHMSLPAIQSVTLTNCFRPFKLEMLLAAFPNLDGTLIITDYTSTYDNEPLVYFRGENRAAQKMHAWKGLDRVAASAVMLYALGLTCSIRHLTLNPAPVVDPRRPEASGNGRAVLQDSAPSHLALVSVRLLSGLSVLFDSLFTEETVARLTHLVLHAKYINPQEVWAAWQAGSIRLGEEGPSWDAVLDTLVAGLKILRLTHVHVVLSCEIDCPWGPLSAAIYDGTRRFKFDRLLAALPHVMPSLTHIFITSSGSNIGAKRERETWKTSRAWRVRRLPVGIAGGPLESHKLEELSAADGEAVMDREELNATTRIPWITYQKTTASTKP